MVTKLVTRVLIWLLVFTLTAPTGVISQNTEQVSESQQNYTYSQEDLDRMLAPIALYPDLLLSQILMASTYPLEVVEADRWLRKNPNLTGDALDEALKDQPWDVSVKSLCHYPEILSTMSSNLSQTSALGDAFLDQQDQVMDTVQNLRQKAQAQGNLRSTEQQTVTSEGQDIVIEPARPEVIYVPVYDPCWVYGPWWYPACSPFWFWYPGLVAGTFIFSPPIFIKHRHFWCGFHWRRHRIFVDIQRTLPFNRLRDTRMHGGRETWRHDPIHRRGVAYRNETVRQRFGRATMQGEEARRNFRGFAPPTERQQLQQRRQETQRSQLQEPKIERLQPRGPAGERFQSQRPEVQRQQTRVPEIQRIQPRPEMIRPRRGGFGEMRSPDSFQGIGRGPEVRQQSERGWGSMSHGYGSARSRGGSPSFGGGRGGGGFVGGSRGGGGGKNR